MNRRFFSDDSFWNTPIPVDARTDPDSARLVEVLRDARPAGFWVNCTTFTIPVYEVTAATPRHTVLRRFTLDPESCPFSDAVKTSLPWITPDHPMGHGLGFGVDVPIPDDAIPDPDGDAHIALVDWERGLAWDMWAARRRDDGRWESCSGMVYRVDGPGVFPLEQFAHLHNGETVHMYGPSRAPGVPAIAGLTMEHELRAGEIPHRLAFASAAVALQQFVHPPACWTDGPVRGGFPEGAVLQLDPDLDPDRLDLSPAGRTIARAWQRYGAVCVDGCGGNVLYAEGLYGHPGRSWDDLLTSHDVEALGYGHFRVVFMENVIHKGDTRHVAKHEGNRE